jgi:hypothetical protein
MAPIKPYIVFGWKMHQMILVDGATHGVVYREDVRIEKSESWMFWTKGQRVFDQVPDLLTDTDVLVQRGNFVANETFAGKVFPKGRYIIKAVGDAENWCFNISLNDNDFPNLQGIWLAAGESYSAIKQELLFIVSGDTSAGSGPLQVEITSDTSTIVANTDTSIIKFSRRK